MKSISTTNTCVPLPAKRKEKGRRAQNKNQKASKTHYVYVIERKRVIIIHGDMLKAEVKKKKEDTEGSKMMSENRHHHHIDEANSANN